MAVVMTSPLDTIRRRAAASLATLYFDGEARFVPRVGEPVDPCYAKLKNEQDLQPVGYSTISDVFKQTVVYLKAEIADSLVEPGAYFVLDDKKYVIEATADNDTDILGRVIVRYGD